MALETIGSVVRVDVDGIFLQKNSIHIHSHHTTENHDEFFKIDNNREASPGGNSWHGETSRFSNASHY
jgi:hypothetical protein